MKKYKILFLWGMIAILGLVATGCISNKDKQKQLERVAKDWSMVIRASQVIPVYPLTEDLRPGDVFLVQTPVNLLPELYKDDGFLPLEQMVARIPPENYTNFYGSTSINGNEMTPFKHSEGDLAGMTNAPRAAFPTYNFSITRGGGMNMALPISGVPIAMNFMKTKKTQVSVTISAASTYGIDILTLYSQVNQWANDNMEQLASFVLTDTNRFNSTNYLRVVNRVYQTRRVDINMSDGGSTGFAVSGGADKDVTVPAIADNADGSYTNMMNDLNASVTDVVPGGSLKFTSATSRGVSLQETFPNPLVIGYLAYDIPMLRGNEAVGEPPVVLGAPIPTQSLLGKVPVNAPTGAKFTYQNDVNSKLLRLFWKPDGSTINLNNQDALKAWMRENVPAQRSVSFFIKSAEYAADRRKAIADLKIGQ